MTIANWLKPIPPVGRIALLSVVLPPYMLYAYLRQVVESFRDDYPGIKRDVKEVCGLLWNEPWSITASATSLKKENQ